MSKERDPLGANYRKLWTSSAISNIGDGVRMTALPLLGASISRDPVKIAAIDLFSTRPWRVSRSTTPARFESYEATVPARKEFHGPLPM